MAYLVRNEAKIFYEAQGDTGEWVTLINGHTRTSQDFKLLSKKLISYGFRTIIFDNRGSGNTESQRPISLVDIVGDIKELWEKLNVTSSCVVGISMGGLIARALAHTEPAHIKKICLISTCCREDIKQIPREPWAKDLKDIEKKLRFYFSKKFLEKNELIIKLMAKEIQKKVLHEDFLIEAANQLQAIELFAQADSYLVPKNVPALILHGSEDQIIPLVAAKHLQALIPHAKLDIWQDNGHLLLAENGSKLCETLAQFFKA